MKKERAPAMTIALAIMLEMRACEVAEVRLSDTVLFIDAYDRTCGNLQSRELRIKYCQRAVTHHRFFERSRVEHSMRNGMLVPEAVFAISDIGESTLRRWILIREKEKNGDNEPKTLTQLIAKKRKPIGEAIVKEMAVRGMITIFEDDFDVFETAIATLGHFNERWKMMHVCQQSIKISDLFAVGGVKIKVKDGEKKPVRYYILTKAGYTMYISQKDHELNQIRRSRIAEVKIDAIKER